MENNVLSALIKYPTERKMMSAGKEESTGNRGTNPGYYSEPIGGHRMNQELLSVFLARG